SPFSPDNSTTMFIGTQTGRIFKVAGLPFANASSVEINSGELPVGFISSIDVGEDEDHLLVTFTNYNTQSVWITRDGGQSWENVERNLPDFPVRWGIFNENNYENVLLATEDGVWYNADVSDPSESWVQMDGFPDVRVDMIKMKGIDRVIATGTHGRGLFLGKIPEELDAEEDPVISSVTDLDQSIIEVFPNPVDDVFTVSYKMKGDSYTSIDLYDLNGKKIRHLFDGKANRNFSKQFPANDLPTGTYILVISDGKNKLSRKIIKS
ncbi:MAG: T9SS type A sorting domain-containing protein, partial [Bacteroidota bacterium]